MTQSHEELLEGYIEYNKEERIAKVIIEDLLQIADYMSIENLRLLSEYAMTLEEN